MKSGARKFAEYCVPPEISPELVAKLGTYFCNKIIQPYSALVRHVADPDSALCEPQTSPSSQQAFIFTLVTIFGLKQECPRSQGATSYRSTEFMSITFKNQLKLFFKY